MRAVFKGDFDVRIASSGPEAIALARSEPVDVCVCDIMMPGMSGLDVLQELNQLDRKINVILLTAFETIETACEALRHGASAYLTKPFDIDSMREAVTKAVRKHRDNDPAA